MIDSIFRFIEWIYRALEAEADGEALYIGILIGALFVAVGVAIAMMVFG